MTRNVFPATRRYYLSATCGKEADVQVYKAMKARAEASGTSLSKMLMEACRYYLENS